jgi:hypothetical protein
LLDGESGIFFAAGLDRVWGDLPGGLFCRIGAARLRLRARRSSWRLAILICRNYASGIAMHCRRAKVSALSPQISGIYPRWRRALFMPSSSGRIRFSVTVILIDRSSGLIQIKAEVKPREKSWTLPGAIVPVTVAKFGLQHPAPPPALPIMLFRKALFSDESN